MSQTVVPMIHVSDVSATVDLYISIGFKVLRQNEEDGKVNGPPNVLSPRGSSCSPWVCGFEF